MEPGKFADIVILDKDYLNIPEQNIRTLKSVLTIVNGQIVYQDKAVMPEI
ncbi:amidohydrolase family protein [Algicola sagamiensis]